jgi:hypothetical protein
MRMVYQRTPSATSAMRPENSWPSQHPFESFEIDSAGSAHRQDPVVDPLIRSGFSSVQFLRPKGRRVKPSGVRRMDPVFARRASAEPAVPRRHLPFKLDGRVADSEAFAQLLIYALQEVVVASGLRFDQIFSRSL